MAAAPPSLPGQLPHAHKGGQQGVGMQHSQPSQQQGSAPKAVAFAAQALESGAAKQQNQPRGQPDLLKARRNSMSAIIAEQTAVLLGGLRTPGKGDHHEGHGPSKAKSASHSLKSAVSAGSSLPTRGAVDAEGDGHGKPSISRTISSYFKTLFTSKSGVPNDDDAYAPGASPSSMTVPGRRGQAEERDDWGVDESDTSGTPRAAPGRAVHAMARSFTTTAAATKAERQAVNVKLAPRSSTAALQSQVAAAMRRMQSFTGRPVTAPALLATCRDLPSAMARPEWRLQDYSIVDKMYTGYASSVYKAVCKLSGELVCLKAYPLSNLCELNRFQIFREIKLHSSLCHDNIIKLYGAFQEGEQIVLVQEFAEAGDLFNLLQRHGGRLSEQAAIRLVVQPFVSVLHYLHSNGVAHRDIKPENILFLSNMQLKLCDFGLAINMREENAVTRAGTLEYMAPEVLNCPYKNKPDENKEAAHLHYSFHVDTWAVGVLCYELLVGIPPFSDAQRNLVEDKIRIDIPRFPNKMSPEAKDFITRALEKNPAERPTALHMLQHPWLRTAGRVSAMMEP